MAFIGMLIRLLCSALMALIGMIFRDGLLCSALVALIGMLLRDCLLCSSAHSAHRHALPGLPPLQPRS